jgi:hypothetical protein
MVTEGATCFRSVRVPGRMVQHYLHLLVYVTEFLVAEKVWRGGVASLLERLFALKVAPNDPSSPHHKAGNEFSSQAP